MKPLDVHEAAARINAAMETFQTASDAMDALDDSGATILEDAHEILSENLSEAGHSIATVLVMETWFALVPHGYRGPKIDFASLKKRFETTLFEFTTLNKRTSPDELLKTLEGRAQPSLMAILMNHLFEGAKSNRGRMLLDMTEILMIAALLAAEVECLDAALRR